MTVKLKDIAKHLNVSVSTVSRVINNRDRVDEKTRKRILEALEEFQYRPNEVARSLKSKTTKAIGLIVPGISNYFFATVIKGVEAIARQHGYHLILCMSDEDKEREGEYTDFLLQRQISGLVVAIVGREAGFFQKYKNLGIPVVFIDNLPDIDDNFDYVVIDNVKASRELTNHLIHIGHQKIAMITGSLHESVSDERLEGWKKALTENGIPINKKWVGIGDFKQESGYRIMQGFLQQAELPTAIVAANNLLAYGAMQAIMEAGLRIPEDIAVVCFDAIDFIGLIKPQLTSVIQPAEDIGTIAGEIILRKMNQTKMKVFERIMLEPQLEIKESCGYSKQADKK
ncbi:LacI family DNA-binding transcriptional regulator [Paenibacillus eucommiae]|uniref:LacI family transcriptional regulator n=1 Tax=Paenibacillus eucommiae TaxID=1355755 RepID=A0ABS4IUA1_9BACL|nr:LacI family DNA-binding transcriptional regulator [Paenibacillus eucommiae]MBP1991162.1 LacI family transcriptional regulator [Paenibacillus eucommiae]